MSGNRDAVYPPRNRNAHPITLYRSISLGYTPMLFYFQVTFSITLLDLRLNIPFIL